jgi:ElaB/YqjD/DUF883 family membrane-anchored ribosome-binding protein
MLRGRTESTGERDVREHFDALLSAVEELRKDLTVARLKQEDWLRDGSDLLTTGRQQVRNIAGQVEERPFVSLALAFATGLIVGGLLRR